jgi:hypothetical protein
MGSSQLSDILKKTIDIPLLTNWADEPACRKVKISPGCYPEARIILNPDMIIMLTVHLLN